MWSPCARTSQQAGDGSSRAARLKLKVVVVREPVAMAMAVVLLLGLSSEALWHAPCSSTCQTMRYAIAFTGRSGSV
jgi:hypothetical protein